MNTTLFRIYFSVFCYSFFCSINLFGQEKDYSAIDRYAKNAPLGISNLYKPLTHYLTDKYITDDEKVRSIAVWIVNNIKYDTKVIRTDNRKKLSPNKILAKRKAICQGYCDLFEAMCKEAGTDVRTVVGYDKGGNYEPTDIFVRDDHSWSAVNIDGGWQLMDLTWASGYVVSKRQTLRRLLYYFLNVPFKQKYRFVKKVNYNYYCVNPDTFAIDHLPTHPWWQLTSEKSILKFEKDTTLRKFEKDVTYAKPSLASIPAMDNSDVPVAYLKKAEVAFEFNPKNYRTLAEGKAMYSYKWYRLTKKSKTIENKDKVEVYDSCKTVIDEAKDAMKAYIKSTSKERDVRKTKNKDYNKEAKDFNKYQKKKIASETQKNYDISNTIDRQIDKLKAEKRNLKNELSAINDLKTPERKKDPDSEISKTDYFAYFSRLSDSMDLLKNNLNFFLAKNKSENFDFIKQNEDDIDSLIGISCKWIYKKIVYRFYFDWNYKIAVDTLQYQHNAISNKKDSIIFLQAKQIKEVADNDEYQASLSSQIRAFYFQKLKFNYSIYASCKDTVIKALNIKDSCKEIKTGWRDYNNERVNQNDKEIQRLKNKKRSLASINRKLRLEKWYNNKEIDFEGKRYKYFNRYYFKFYRKEKKKAVTYYKNLSALKREIQLEDSACKGKVREEERKEREENKVQNKTK